MGWLTKAWLTDRLWRGISPGQKWGIQSYLTDDFGGNCGLGLISPSILFGIHWRYNGAMDQWINSHQSIHPSIHLSISLSPRTKAMQIWGTLPSAWLMDSSSALWPWPLAEKLWDSAAWGGNRKMELTTTESDPKGWDKHFWYGEKPDKIEDLKHLPTMLHRTK